MSSFENKMKNYEVVPPASVWDKIATALDESALDNEFPTRLYNMELNPPANAWDNISSSLGGEEAPVVSMKRRAPSFWRYAAAAIFIGVIATGIIKWANNNSVTQGTGIANTDTLKKSIPANNNNTVNTNNETANSQPGPSRPVPDDKMLAQVTSAKTHARKTSHPAASANYDYNEYADQYTNPIYAYETDAPKLADRYIMLMTPDGNLIRVSKKLGNLVCCVSGEEQDADCKSQIKKWQEKMASSQSTSPGNFLDILNLVGSLDDNGTEL